MRRYLFLIIGICLLCGLSYADTVDGIKSDEFEITQWDAISTPSVSPANTARIYYNGTSDTLQMSLNGGAYSPFVTSTSGDARYFFHTGVGTDTKSYATTGTGTFGDPSAKTAILGGANISGYFESVGAIQGAVEILNTAEWLKAYSATKTIKLIDGVKGISVASSANAFYADIGTGTEAAKFGDAFSTVVIAGGNAAAAITVGDFAVDNAGNVVTAGTLTGGSIYSTDDTLGIGLSYLRADGSNANSVLRNSTLNTSYRACGKDATYIYLDGGGATLSKMDSAGTITTGNVFTGKYVTRVFPTNTAGVILILVQTNTSTNATFDIYKSSDYGSTLDNSGNPVLVLGDGNDGVGGQTKNVSVLARGCITATLSAAPCILLGEYNTNGSRTAGAANDRVRVMKSTDDGANWTQLGVWNTVVTQNNVRHLHGLKYDSATGAVYFMFGDVDAECGIIKWNGTSAWDIDNIDISAISSAGFNTLHSAQRYRTVDMIVTANSVIWGSDTPTTGEAGIWTAGLDLSSPTRINSDIQNYGHLLMYTAESTDNYYIVSGFYTDPDDRYFMVYANDKTGTKWRNVARIQSRDGVVADLNWDFFWWNSELWFSSLNLQNGSTAVTRAFMSFKEDTVPIKFGNQDRIYNNTQIFTPEIVGGTTTTSDLNFKTTTATGATGADMHFLVGTNGGTEAMTILNNSNVGIGQTTPTAKLHLKAGTATAGTAPLKLASGTSLTAAEAGAVEFTTDDLYFTITTGAARKGILLNDGTNLTSGRMPYVTTNGRLTDEADLAWDGANQTITYAGITAFSYVSALTLTSGSTATDAGTTRYFSPALTFSGREYTSGADKQMQWGILCNPGSGENASYLLFVNKKGTAGWTIPFQMNDTGDWGTSSGYYKVNVGETPTFGLQFYNGTAATNVLDQYSPSFRMRGQGWKTAATAGSQSMVVESCVAPEQGATNPIGVLKWFYGTNATTTTETNELLRMEWGDRLGFKINSLDLAGFVTSIDNSLILAAGSITDTTGAISFDNENLTTTGTVTAAFFQTSTAPTANSTGTVAIVAKDTNLLTNNAGWLPLKKSDGTTVYVPYWA